MKSSSPRLTSILILLSSQWVFLWFCTPSVAGEAITESANTQPTNLMKLGLKPSPAAGLNSLQEAGLKPTPIKPFHSDQSLCLKCHQHKDGKSLILLTGELIAKDRVVELCGQCHGVIKRNWSLGIHGKKINSWTKSGERIVCIICHKPHEPKFPKMKAVHTFTVPKFLIPKGSSHE